MKTSAASKSVSEMSERQQKAPVFPFESTAWTCLLSPWNIIHPSNVPFLIQTQTWCEGLQQLGRSHPRLPLSSVFILKNRRLKVVWGFSTVVRRRRICLLTSFVLIIPRQAAQINISHDTRALHFHWTKQTHRTADVILLITGDKEEECWSF